MPSPSQTSLREVAETLTWVALGASFLGAGIGWARGSNWKEVILTALSLAFATIPEELPILIAGVLAVGGMALSRRKIFVKNLRAQESLAYVDVVLTDKTGTLTVRIPTRRRLGGRRRLLERGPDMLWLCGLPADHAGEQAGPQEPGHGLKRHFILQHLHQRRRPAPSGGLALHLLGL